MSPELTTEGVRLVERAQAASLPLRLFGGVAIWSRSSAETRAALGREYADIDLVAHRKGSRELRTLLEAESYVPERTFNATHGARRLLYHAPDAGFHIDVFLDRFEMSHTLDFEPRLELEPVTLTAADLLMAKLQVAEINAKDLSDTAMLLLDHAPADSDGVGQCNLAHIAQMCAGDWGLFTTFNDNLEKLTAILPSLPLDPSGRERVGDRAGELHERMVQAPKTRGWKRRDRVGRRKRWYEVPEEVTR